MAHEQQAIWDWCEKQGIKVFSAKELGLEGILTQVSEKCLKEIEESRQAQIRAWREQPMIYFT